MTEKSISLVDFLADFVDCNGAHWACFRVGISHFQLFVISHDHYNDCERYVELCLWHSQVGKRHAVCLQRHVDDEDGEIQDCVFLQGPVSEGPLELEDAKPLETWLHQLKDLDTQAANKPKVNILDADYYEAKR